MTRNRTRAVLVTSTVAALALLPACAGPQPDAATSAPSTTTGTRTAEETATLRPRLVLTYDGGVQVLDATTLKVVGDLPVDGFTRVNAAGDGRHVLVTTADGFRVLDAGTWAQAHGDHAHNFTVDPLLTEATHPADAAGHVVAHAGRTALFADGTGQVTVLDAADVADPDAETRTVTTPTAHHGVAVELSDRTLLVTEGTEEARTGARALDADGHEVAASDGCPGVHGEAVAADEAVLLGCEDGALVYADGTFTKVTSPDGYGRVGNLAGTESSPVVLGDYKSDPDATLERPTRVSLIDTRAGELTLVELPASYTFRSLARGDDGEALVLGTDGALHVIDPQTGTLTRSVPVIDPWTEPEDWQQPRPALTVLDGTAYVTDPATDRVLAVDVLTGEVWRTADLTVTPNEVAVATGEASEDAGRDGHDHTDEDHEHGEDEHGTEDGHDHEGA